jgi:hypothetical protein
MEYGPGTGLPVPGCARRQPTQHEWPTDQNAFYAAGAGTPEIRQLRGPHASETLSKRVSDHGPVGEPPPRGAGNLAERGGAGWRIYRHMAAWHANDAPERTSAR